MEEESLVVVETDDGFNAQMTLNVSRDDNPFTESLTENTIANGTSCSERYKGNNIKHRILSPASDSFAHNKAFSCETDSVLKEKLSNQGAIPKVRAVTGCSTSPTGSDISFVNDNINNVNAIAQNLVFTEIKSETGSPVSPSSNGSNNLNDDVQTLLKGDNDNRWADIANCPIKYIDDEQTGMRRVNSQEAMLICDSSQLLRSNSGKERRLYFSSVNNDTTKIIENSMPFEHRNSIFSINSENEYNNGLTESIDEKGASSVLENDIFSSGRKLRESASLPSSPLKRLDNQDSPTHKLREEAFKTKCKHHSPIFKRKAKYPRQLENSTEELTSTLKENNQSFSYKNLENFQKTQMKQKVSNYMLSHIASKFVMYLS